MEIDPTQKLSPKLTPKMTPKLVSQSALRQWCPWCARVSQSALRNAQNPKVCWFLKVP